MDREIPNHPNRLGLPGMNRRMLLRGVALAGVAASGAAGSFAPARAEIWEEGDEQCQAVVAEVTPDYDTGTLLQDFMALSELLTGVKPLDPRIGAQYLQRYARHPELTKLLPPLIKAYADVAQREPAEQVKWITQSVMQEPTVLGPAAEQLIYVWYVSAFFLPINHGAASRSWLYGTVEQYHYALLWSVIDAHAPMTRGGDYGYWASDPNLPKKPRARSGLSYQHHG
jgi:hypothetical protein